MQVLLIANPAGALHLKVETFRKHCLPLGPQGFGLSHVARQQGQANLAFTGAGQGDQPGAGLFQPITLDHHQVVVLTFGPATGNQFGQVAVTASIHGQQGQAGQRAILVAAGQPDIRTADRLDTAAHGGLVELHQRAHVAHVGHCHRRHTGSRHRLDQRFDPHQAIDQGVFGVQTEMNETGGHGNPVAWKNAGADCSPSRTRCGFCPLCQPRPPCACRCGSTAPSRACLKAP